jgi:hypothetical protein
MLKYRGISILNTQHWEVPALTTLSFSKNTTITTVGNVKEVGNLFKKHEDVLDLNVYTIITKLISCNCETESQRENQH